MKLDDTDSGNTDSGEGMSMTTITMTQALQLAYAASDACCSLDVGSLDVENRRTLYVQFGREPTESEVIALWAGDWEPTHVIVVDGGTPHERTTVVLLENDAAYTHKQWHARTAADWECLDGAWLFEGEPVHATRVTVHRIKLSAAEGTMTYDGDQLEDGHYDAHAVSVDDLGRIVVKVDGKVTAPTSVSLTCDGLTLEFPKKSDMTKLEESVLVCDPASLVGSRQSPEVRALLADLVDVYRKHGLSVGHSSDDCQEALKVRALNEKDVGWLLESYDETRQYTYTIYDSEGSLSTHTDVKVASDGDGSVLETALEIAADIGHSCGRYSLGDRLTAMVCDADGNVVAAQALVLSRDSFVTQADASAVFRDLVAQRKSE